ARLSTTQYFIDVIRCTHKITNIILTIAQQKPALCEISKFGDAWDPMVQRKFSNARYTFGFVVEKASYDIRGIKVLRRNALKDVIVIIQNTSFIMLPRQAQRI